MNGMRTPEVILSPASADCVARAVALVSDALGTWALKGAVPDEVNALMNALGHGATDCRDEERGFPESPVRLRIKFDMV